MGFWEVLISEVGCQGWLYCLLFPSSFAIMLSSLSNLATAPPIVLGDQPEGTQVPVVLNCELKQGAFCIVNPDFWGAGDCWVFNGTMNYTEVCSYLLILS